MNELDYQLSVIKSKTEEIVPESELKAKVERSINTNTPLKIKFGIDPTGSDMHIGHAVPLRKLKQLQELGHSIEFLIGSFTAKIGDPTGKNESRKMLSDEQIEKNFKTYLDQASEIIDIEKINVHFNGDWLSKLHFEDIVNIMSKFSLSLMISREDFANRLKNNTPISLVELAYPLMQAYDSVYLNADIEIGGTEQKFNLLRGRDLQKAFGQEPQVCVMLPILEGLKGRDKMSKSLNNYISIKDSSNDMFGKIMSITDDILMQYYNLVTELPDEDIEEISKAMSLGMLKPYEAKKMLAYETVKLYYDEIKAGEAHKYFESLFSKKETPENIEKVSITDITLSDFISNHIGVSKTQARRLINDGAVKHKDKAVLEDKKIEKGIWKIGKKTILEIV
jgi:tyrosyl-tRNA synthetase